MAKVRISALAKELGVKSKAVLDKLREEGMIEQAPNHQSTVGIGLQMTIREWFSGAQGAESTAVETGKAVDDATKSQARKSSKKTTKKSAPKLAQKTESGDDDVGAEVGETATAVMEPPAETAEPVTASTASTVSEAAPADTKAAAAPAGGDDQASDEASDHADEPEEAVAEKSPVESAPSTPASTPGEPVAEKVAEKPVEKAAEQPAPAADAPVRAPAEAKPTVKLADTPTDTPSTPDKPAAGQPKTAIRPAAKADDGEDGKKIDPRTGLAEPTMRPTVTLADKQREIQERLRKEKEARMAQPVEAAPQLTTLKKAEVKGPKVVRVEQPDHVPTPRKKGERPQRSTPDRIPTGPLAKAGGGVKARPAEDDSSNRSLSGRRRGGEGGRRGEALEKLREFTDADIIARRDALNAARANRSLLDQQMARSARKGQGYRAPSPASRGGPVEITQPITVKSLSGDLGVKSTAIIRALMKQGSFATINQSLDTETAESLAMEFGIEVQVAEMKSAEEKLLDTFKEREEALTDEEKKDRPPVVTILGHVDHGKTSLLDKIRSANVASGEAGGITQHTAAFSVEVERAGKKGLVTFIDTPGHQAFTAMRARGAQVTDIVVLVVDAAQGIQPQTVESINHARAADVPIVVAMNKIDREDANPDKILGELAGQNLNPSEWGGDTEVVRTSAMTGQGIDDLLEILDVQAEIMELKAAPEIPARGRVIEARMMQGLGPVATVLVQQGTLKVGDVILAGTGFGRVRSLRDSTGKNIKEAGPAMPVLVAGFNEVPDAGDAFFVMPSQDEAEKVADERRNEERQKELASENTVSLESLFKKVDAGKVTTLNIIVKADVNGNVETLKSSVDQHNTDEVQVKVIHAGVGSVSESDVELASASEAVVFGFHVGVDEGARHLAERRHVEIRTYNVIYEIFDDIKASLSGMLTPEVQEVYQGTAEVRATFRASRLGTIAGCFVTDGKVLRSSKARLIRDGGVVVEDLNVGTLRRVKDDVREVTAGLECGINLEGYNDVKEGDKLEFYKREEVARSL